MKYNIEEIKANTSLSGIYENLTGWRLRNNAGNCPFHDSKSKTTFSIKDDNYFKCFSCGVSGDAVKFVMQCLNKSFSEACQYLGCEVLLETEMPLKTQRKPPVLEPLPELAETTKQIYQYFFELLTLTDAGNQYLKGRGLNDTIIEQYKIKSIDQPETVFNSLLAKYTVEQLQAAGLTKIGKDNKHHFIFYMPCLIFTVFEDNQPVFFSSRNFTADHNRRFLKLAGIKQRYFSGELSADKIYIFESLIDALSFTQLTGNNNFIVLSGLDSWKFEAIKNSYPDKSIIAVFDNDKPGLLAKKEISDRLEYSIPSFKFELFMQHLGLKQNYYKDFNQVLQVVGIKAGNKDVIKAQIPRFKDYECYNDYLQNSSLLDDYAKHTGRNPDCVAGDYIDYLFDKAGTEQKSLLACIGERWQ